MTTRALGLLLTCLLLAGCPQDPGKVPVDPRPAPKITNDLPTDAVPVADDPAKLAAPSGPLSKLSVGEPLLRGWVQEIARVPAAAFTPQAKASQQLATYRIQSGSAAGLNLLPQANPHRLPGTTWSAAPARQGGLDLLRCRYEALGHTMELNEGWNLQVLRIELAQPLQRAALASLLAKVVRHERLSGEPWRFELAGYRSDKPFQVANTGAPPLAQVKTRDDRADLFVTQTQVVLVFYKRVPQLLTWNHGERWFRPSTRKALGGV